MELMNANRRGRRMQSDRDWGLSGHVDVLTALGKRVSHRLDTSVNLM